MKYLNLFFMCAMIFTICPAYLSGEILYVEQLSKTTIGSDMHQAGESPYEWLQLIGSKAAVKILKKPLEYQGISSNQMAGSYTWRQSRPSRFSLSFDTTKDGPFSEYLNAWDLIGRPGESLYIAFLFQSSGGEDRYNQISFGAKRFADDEGAQRISIIRNSEGRWVLSVLPANQYYAYSHDLGVATDEVELFVLRIDFHSDRADQLTLWRNPELDPGNEPEPSLSLSNYPSPRPNSEDSRLKDLPRSLAFNQMLRYSGPIRMKDAKNGSLLSMNALRVGTTWSSILSDEN